MKKGDVPIGSPCEAEWSAMAPAAGGRFCGDCKKVVRHLSEMTEADAKALLRRGKSEELCVRYLYDREGSVVFADRRPAQLVPASLLHRAKRAAAVAALPAALAACTTPSFLSSGAQALQQEEEREQELQSNMGGVSADEVRALPIDAGTDARSDADAAEDPELPSMMGGISADGLDLDGPTPDGGADGGR
jgi:hypothetical protein